MLRLIALETRLLLRERLAWLALLTALAACFLAAAQGLSLIAAQQEGREAFVADQAVSEAEMLTTIREANPDEAAFVPRWITMPVAAPIPPLADFTAGRAKFESYTTVARLGVREDGLFKRARFDNPDLLARGDLDLVFVAVVVLPLLLIALGYGVFATDRDSGVARLALVQQPSALRLLAARTIPRLLLVVCPLLLAAMMLLALGPDLPGRMTAAGWWIALAIMLLLFWWMVILVVNSFRISAESAALTLVSLWVVFTLVLPALVTVGTQAFNPPPSRFEQIATARAAQIEVTAEWENDHPELTDDAAERVRQARRSVEIDRAIEETLAPLAAGFEARRQDQQRMTRAFSFLSPSLVAANGQAAVAGTDGRTWLAFRTATGAYLAEIKTRLGATLVSGVPIDERYWRELPQFEWQMPAHRPVGPFVYLLLFTILAGAVAAYRFRRVEFD